MTTNSQKAAVRFCEFWLEIPFAGDINNFKEVSKFLSEHLDNAKSICEDVVSSYYSNFNYQFMKRLIDKNQNNTIIFIINAGNKERRQ